MTLNDAQKMFAKEAKRLGNYQAMTKTDLANGYCDAEELAYAAKQSGDTDVYEEAELKRSAYYSALMLRYWYKIFEWIKNSSSLCLDYTDYIDWLSDSLYVAFYYRAWRWENEATVKEGRFIAWKVDENGQRIPNDYYWRNDLSAPDKIINRCCGSMRGRVYQYYNKDKRKTDVQTYSIDSMIEDQGDAAVEAFGAYTLDTDGSSSAYDLIQEFIVKKEYLEALVLDGVFNYDTFKTKKKKVDYDVVDEDTNETSTVTYVRRNNIFDPRKLVKHLAEIDEDFIVNFCNMYSIQDTKKSIIYDKLKALNNTKLYKLIDKTREEIKQTPSLRSYLEATMSNTI